MLLEVFLCGWIDMWNMYTEHKLQTRGVGHKRWCERAISPNQGWTHVICILGSGPWGGRCLVALCCVVPTQRSRCFGKCLCVSGNHPPVVPGWASGGWRHSCLSGLADPCWFIIECVGSSLANCFVWFVLSRELLLNIGMGLWWHPGIFVVFSSGLLFG